MVIVRVIPAKNNLEPKIKVDAYCRVSTKSEFQLASLKAQEEYYEDLINNNPAWIFAGVYSDIGSGTRAKGRKNFNAMISACRRRKIDMVLIKSAQRFARNTVDALKTIRLLRRWNVDIYFELENIHTIAESSEFMLTVICAKAQAESHSKSEDIKWGIHKTFEDCNSKYYQRVCYGYTHDENGKLVPKEEEAEVVRLIFKMSAARASLNQIAQRLKDLAIPSPRGKANWSRETLRKILHNEKYYGNVRLQKTFVENYLEHKQVKNEGQLATYLLERNHEAIIDI